MARRLSPDQGLELLDVLLQNSVPPEKIDSVIQELLSAEDTKVTTKGDFYKTTNWSAKIAGLEQALKLKRFTQARDGNVGDQPITKITFNVIENVNVGKIADINEKAAG
jgi:hypothetical protein